MSILDRMAAWSEFKVKEYGARYVAFGIFSVVNYLLPMYMWSDEHSGEVAVYSVRIAAILLSFFIAVSETIPAKYQKYRPLLWHFTVMFCLPFFVTFMVWHEGITLLWIINGCLACLLGLILLDFMSFLVLYIGGMLIGAVVAMLLGYRLQLDMPDFLLYPSLYMCVFICGIVMVFSRDREKNRTLQLNAMRALASTIAHEVRTPLATVSMLLKSMKLSDEKVSKETAERFDDKRKKALSEVSCIFSLIDLMLMKVSIFNRNCVEIEPVYIQDLVQESIDRYLRDDFVQKILRVNVIDNFSVNINKTLMLHVIFNLVQNAEYQVKAEGKGEIYILAGQERKWKYLTIKDTASGIHPDRIKSIFEPFVTFKPQGTGLGLSFCKTVVESMNACIECRSEYGKYTEFTIKF
ncbi:MAG: HAMP domain-containing histidine kinase [Alphaproteobacteria bacterium]|nr:HAMP domain-containing histidine kinase [Alphaproteobacteria bacterium]